MDKIKMRIIREKFRIKNMTIRQAFVFFTFVSLLAAIAAISLEIMFFEHLYKSTIAPYLTEQEIAPGFHTQIVSRVPTGMDSFIIDSISNWQMFAICGTVGGIIIGEALLFYKLKLKKPIKILNEASEKIADNDLNFHIFYGSKDEMGQLCSSFEKMRASLEENNREMWRSMEERKRLNAAFSHDLRTPLTVLRGYSDFLKNYLPQGKVSGEKMISTVSTMSEHISRLESYVKMMSEVQRLEDICVSAEKVNMPSFLEQLKSTAEVLVQGQKFKIQFVNDIAEKDSNIDAEIVVRVFENLISNAVRYAESTVTIRCKSADGVLAITVSDDGKGFTDEDLKQVTKPFYKSKTNTSELHFGLGLNICKILCEKHGGGILLENGKHGGASVTARFFCGIKNNV